MASRRRACQQLGLAGECGHAVGRGGGVLLQKGDNVLVEPLLGNVNGQPVHVIRNVTVGPVIQQCSGSLETALPGGQEKWCFVFQVLGIAVGIVVLVALVVQQYEDGLDVVHGGRPMEGGLSILVGNVHVGVVGDQEFHHVLHGEPGGQDQGRGSVVGFGVEVGAAVLDKVLENTLCIGSHGSMERGPSRVVLGVRITAMVKQDLGRMATGKSGSQVEWRLAGLLHSVVDLGLLR